jgi:hypothetical protein
MSVVVSKAQLNVQGQVHLFRQLYHGGPFSPPVEGTMGNFMHLIWSKALPAVLGQCAPFQTALPIGCPSNPPVKGA